VLSIANILGINGLIENRAACIVQGFLIQSSQVAIINWVTVISLNLFLFVVLDRNTVQYERYYHIFAWCWALFASSIEFVSGPDVYALSGAWCWISEEFTIYRFLFFYIPEIIQITLMIVFSAFAVQAIDDNKPAKVKELVRKLRAYPVLFIALYIFPFIQRIYDAASPVDSFPLYMLQCLTCPSIGFWIALIYCLDIRNEISGRFISCRNSIYKVFCNPDLHQDNPTPDNLPPDNHPPDNPPGNPDESVVSSETCYSEENV